MHLCSGHGGGLLPAPHLLHAIARLPARTTCVEATQKPSHSHVNAKHCPLSETDDTWCANHEPLCEYAKIGMSRAESLNQHGLPHASLFIFFHELFSFFLFPAFPSLSIVAFSFDNNRCIESAEPRRAWSRTATAGLPQSSPRDLSFHTGISTTLSMQ